MMSSGAQDDKNSTSKAVEVKKVTNEGTKEMRATINTMEATSKDDSKDKLMTKSMSFWELMYVLRPFFWPNAGSDGVLMNRIRSVSTWVSVGCGRSSAVVSPLYLAIATNKLIEGDYDTAVTNIVIYCMLKLASSFFKELQGALYVRVKQQASIELQENTFTHLHNLSLGWHLTKKTGTVMKSMDRGIEATGQLVTYMFLFLVPAILECAAVILLFFFKYQEWSIALVIAGGVISYFIVTIAITIWRKKFRDKTNKHDNAFHDKAQDSIVNFETVKYFTAEAYEIQRYKDSVVKYKQYEGVTLTSMQLLNFVQQMILNTTLMGAMIISAKKVSDGRMTIGAWVALQAWIIQMFLPLNFLGSIYGMVVNALIDVRNLSELLNEEPDLVDSPDAKDIPFFTALQKKRETESKEILVRRSNSRDSKDERSEKSNGIPTTAVEVEMMETGALLSASDKERALIDADALAFNPEDGVDVQFKDVHFHYPTQPADKGLQGVSFHMPRGTTTAIVGSTGAGKTTISRLLFRFYDVLKGSVQVGGHDISKATQRSVRGMIGIVPQDTVLFNESIKYNILYGRMDATEEEVELAAESAQIKKFIEGLPEKWETVVGERGLKLSGGEKQRVAIARCLLKNPPIVVLDEATSALDTVTENSVQEALDALGTNRTVLIIAHRLSTIRHADQIIVMDKGVIKERGSHEDLLEIPDGIYSNLWNMQLRKEFSVVSTSAHASRDNLVQEAVVTTV